MGGRELLEQSNAPEDGSKGEGQRQGRGGETDRQMEYGNAAMTRRMVRIWGLRTRRGMARLWIKRDEE
jgi:hypothetical protein